MIYLVDDDEIQNLINTRVVGLVSQSVAVRTFSGGEAALKALDTETSFPQLIFLDINMPKMNGWGFLDEFTKRDYPISIYMLSSSINSKDIEKSQTYKAVNGFISKPLVAEKLAEILKQEKII
ncbi:MAG: response regulator [Flavobacteriales bacterium]|nr:response regulator [Flavobacteriales bacterium]